jgi:ornithine carbamoyltransferase
LNKVEQTTPQDKERKYLITWSLNLSSQELQMMAKQPKALEKGLNYLHNLNGKNKIDIFRVVSINEITSFEGIPNAIGKTNTDPPNGIAILNAESIEDARAMISQLVDGLSYGGLSIRNYLNYEIKPLMEIG